MTRVCARCGWLVFERDRCGRCGGLGLAWRVAARACKVVTLRGLLNLPPAVRVQLIELARFERASRRSSTSATRGVIATR